MGYVAQCVTRVGLVNIRHAYASPIGLSRTVSSSPSSATAPTTTVDSLHRQWSLSNLGKSKDILTLLILCNRGGLELLFDGQKRLEIDLDNGLTVKDLLHKLAREHLQERPELFLKGDSVY